MSSSQTHQSAYHVGRLSEEGDIDKDIYEAMRLHLIGDLGLDEEFATSRAAGESERRPARYALDVLADAGIPVKDKEVLDLGAGLGAMSEELMLRGAHVTSLEPGAAWAKLATRRASRHEGRFRLVEAPGENIPLPDGSVDLVVSLQVLEHVNDPAKVLSEVWRVLRPGGHFYLACENYLAFREGHYRLPWFPLLPKSIGSLYLRALGRPPEFLNESVTYITYPGVLRQCRRLGFVRQRNEEVREALRTRGGPKWKALRALGRAFGPEAPLQLDRAMLTFKFGFKELFHKPQA